MRSRLGGLAVALGLLAGACGSDGGATAAPTARPGHGSGPVDGDLASVRDTLPPAPPSAEALTVVLTHPGGAGDPGLDAAAGALAQRPDIRVVVAVAAGTGDATMSGFPVEVTGPTAADAVAAAIAAEEVDLVVVGVNDGHGIGSSSPEAAVAARHDVAAVVVGAEHAEPPDHAAATVQLLEVLDLELEPVLASEAVHRLAVPSCEHGMLRGRLATRPGAPPADAVRSDCTSTVVPDGREAEAFAHGYAALTRLG